MDFLNPFSSKVEVTLKKLASSSLEKFSFKIVVSQPHIHNSSCLIGEALNFFSENLRKFLMPLLVPNELFALLTPFCITRWLITAF